MHLGYFIVALCVTVYPNKNIKYIIFFLYYHRGAVGYDGIGSRVGLVDIAC